MESQDDALSMGLTFEERLRLAVDHAHSSFTHSKVSGLIGRAGLRYPNADLRQVDLLEERGLNRMTLNELASCAFVDRFHHVVFQGFTGSGKSYLGCALAKQACLKLIRTHYVRMPDLEDEWWQAEDKPLGQNKFLKKYGAFSLLVIDEWLLDPPKGAFLRMPVGTYGTSVRLDGNGVLHPVQAVGLARQARVRSSRGRDHGPDCPQYDPGRDR